MCIYLIATLPYLRRERTSRKMWSCFVFFYRTFTLFVGLLLKRIDVRVLYGWHLALCEL